MRFSGSEGAHTINLQSGKVTGEEILAGTGSLGPFTYRELSFIFYCDRCGRISLPAWKSVAEVSNARRSMDCAV